MTEQVKTCEHVWVKTKRRIMPERMSDKQPQFIGTGAYFVLKVCEKCKEERTLDYKVEI